MTEWKKIALLPEGVHCNVGRWLRQHGKYTWVQSLGYWEETSGVITWRGEAADFVRAYGQPTHYALIPDPPPEPVHDQQPRGERR